jgi:formate-dependent nitrite reductase cytochrome c552 subunit
VTVGHVVNGPFREIAGACECLLNQQKESSRDIVTMSLIEHPWTGSVEDRIAREKFPEKR